MNELIFQKFPKFEPIGSNLRKFWKIGWFCSKFSQKLDRLVYEWVTFSWKIGIFMGLLSNSTAAHPYQNQTWVPPQGLKTTDVGPEMVRGELPCKIEQ